MAPSSLLPDAVRAVQKDMWVFPVNECGTRDADGKFIDKEPHGNPYPYRMRWSEVATNDLNAVAAYWQSWPLANIGTAAKQSGLLIVDCDKPKTETILVGSRWEYLYEVCGGPANVDGEVLFDEVCQRYGGPDAYRQACETYKVRTGSGGLHLYFRWPDGVQASQASLVKGLLDIRGNGGEKGGYVLAEGSVTTKGSYVREGDAEEIRPCPSWLIEICKERPADRVRQASGYAQPGRANYSGLVMKVLTAPEGNRNALLLWCARAMASDGADIEVALDLLGDAGRQAGLSHRACEATIRSGYNLQQRKEGH